MAGRVSARLRAIRLPPAPAEEAGSHAVTACEQTHRSPFLPESNFVSSLLSLPLSADVLSQRQNGALESDVSDLRVILT